MQLWFAHGTEVTLREQLVTQIVLGILCGDLGAGQRLPSTRELARRFRLHPNTVSAGYRQLEEELWVEFRHGSGVYVRDSKPETAASSALALDQLIANVFRAARKLGAPLPAVRSRLRQWLELQPPDHFLVIEPDEELRKIVATEVQNAVTLAVKSSDLKDGRLAEVLEGGVPVALPNNTKNVRQALPHGADLLTLQFRSVPESLAGWLPAPEGALVGIASRWPSFLKFARTMLAAAGFHPDSLMFRDARKPNWQRGLKQSAAVVCDSVTASELPKGQRAIVFPLIAEASLAELRRYEEFIRSPLDAPL
ncbi:MAG TPA: GntR family transcriptional regulator [Candidatus Acidoferrales bacterium]|nr:GntR family transcriptional regulator [Candidatus Acidoferrales bacterium]